MGRKHVKLRTIGERIKTRRERYSHPITQKCVNGKIIIEERKRGLTQQEFADAINVSLDTVKNWEQGYNYPPIDMIILIANFLNCDIDYLFGMRELPLPPSLNQEPSVLSNEALDNLSLAIKHNKSYIKILSFLLEDECFLYQLSNCNNSSELLSDALTDFINRYKKKTD